MSTRRYERERDEPPPRSKCISCLCFSWKVFTCVFSHVTLITLVVAYCVAGAFLFEHLEAGNEKLVKEGIKHIRYNTTELIWKQTTSMDILRQDNWTLEAIKLLQDFETSILKAMKEDGWDGYEPEANKTQWTFTGSLFYSIIVITTIGYGHIAPKTIPGKISTIFYAILGIPLMLLCLSNIGDIMASSFRFLYWRVCCYVCTREPKKKKRQIMRRETYRQQQQLALQDRPVRYPNRFSNHSSIRRSMKTSQRSADSGFDQRYDVGGISHAYSEMDFRNTGANGGHMMDHPLYYEEREKVRGHSFQRGSRGQQQPSSPRAGPEQRDPRYRNSYRGDRHTIDRERFAKYNEPDGYDEDDDLREPAAHVSRRDRMRDREQGPPTPQQPRHLMRHSEDRQTGGTPSWWRPAGGTAPRVQSLDRRMMRRDPVIIDFEQEPPCKAPIYYNKYAMDDMEERRGEGRRPNYRSQSMPRQSRFGDRLVPPGGRGGADNRSLYNESNLEMQPSSKGRKRERPVPSPSPRIMSPMGFAVHRQARHIASVMDENSLYGDDYDADVDGGYIRPVPIWLCVFLVIGYIIGGAFLFKAWERWEFLDAAYFCFITLTTIGFGDFVPAQGEKENPEQSIALCSLYLLFGIALLAMSFNLVQEEVISKVKSIAKRLGIIKDDEIED